jgi:putative oxidoreductase
MISTDSVPAENGTKRLAKKNALLLGGAYFSLAFAAFQISGIFWPSHAIKYFGGPAELSEARPVLYAFLCIVVAAIAAIFGLYAMSGAGRIRRLPLLRTVITATTAIYILRGFLLIPQIPLAVKHPSLIRFALFSMVSLCVGLIHLAGLFKLFKPRSPAEALSNT